MRLLGRCAVLRQKVIGSSKTWVMEDSLVTQQRRGGDKGLILDSKPDRLGVRWFLGCNALLGILGQLEIGTE